MSGNGIQARDETGRWCIGVLQCANVRQVNLCHSAWETVKDCRRKTYSRSTVTWEQWTITGNNQQQLDAEHCLFCIHTHIHTHTHIYIHTYIHWDEHNLLISSVPFPIFPRNNATRSNVDQNIICFKWPREKPVVKQTGSTLHKD